MSMLVNLMMVGYTFILFKSLINIEADKLSSVTFEMDFK